VPASPTFEGRDWFGPAAARLAAGTPLRDLGPSIDAITGLDLPKPRLVDDGVIEGEVLRVDRFGNLITNLDRPAVAGLNAPMPRVQINARVVDGVVSTYADVHQGAVCALFGSTGYLEIACAGGSAAAALHAGRGAAVRVLRGA
jgi:S-adenosylmethionine hydrolase